MINNDVPRPRTLTRLHGSAAEGSAARDRLGEVLGGSYRLERVIGEGGMGAVYEAIHLRVPRRFAVKLLSHSIAKNRQAYERFQREAEVASALGHENIVQVFDFNTAEDGTPYMVLELLGGQDLATYLEAIPRLSPRRVASLLFQVASGLVAAHDAGVVHRDLKPANLFLANRSGRGEVKILDFGVSKMIHADTLATRVGALLGTPDYMAPEQARGRNSLIDERTDVFALGVIVYECLTGVRPFCADTPIGVLYEICHHEPEPPSRLVPGLPAALDRVVAGALAKDRSERTPSVIALRDQYLEAIGSIQTWRAAFDELTPLPPVVSTSSSTRSPAPPVDVARSAFTTVVDRTAPPVEADQASRPAPKRWRILATAALVVIAGGVAFSSLPSKFEEARETGTAPLAVDEMYPVADAAPPTPADTSSQLRAK